MILSGLRCGQPDCPTFYQTTMSEWLKLSRKQQRDIFRECNVHVKNDMRSQDQSIFDMTGDNAVQRLDEVVDLYRPRDAHGTLIFSQHPSNYD